MRWLGLVLALAACNPGGDRKLPGASLTPPVTPRLAKLRASVACGDDVAVDGNATADVRYRYTYDALGRLARATGAYAAGGADDAIDYSYDHLDHMTHMLQSRGWGDTRVEITADYDTLGDLIDYTTEQTSATYHDALHYTFAQFTDGGQPTVEVIADSGQPPIDYQLDYDATGRLAVAIQGGVVPTTYTYDDDARTTTIDTSNGAFHGVISFDDLNRELSEVWGGTDPAAIASDETYEYEDDRLLAVTYRSGTTVAPHDPTTIETDTLRYDCDR